MSPAKAKNAVGIIGLGIMGGAFARNLVKAGWKVVGHDIDPARCRELAKAGVVIAKDAAVLAATVPTIITSLPKPQALIATAKTIVAHTTAPPPGFLYFTGWRACGANSGPSGIAAAEVIDGRSANSSAGAVSSTGLNRSLNRSPGRSGMRRL